MTTAYRIYPGHVLPQLRQLPAQSVQCVVTSPPYWGLRDYGTDEQVWGGKPRCHHRWRTVSKRGHKIAGISLGAFCRRCDAWRGHLGLEPTPQLYVQHLVQILAGVHRVLRNDGVLWLNLGDSYYNDSPARVAGHDTFSKTWQPRDARGQQVARRYAVKLPGLRKKNLCLIPYRVARALQRAGWYLRAEVIWAKGVSFCPTYSGSAMPDGARDRPSRSHEVVFLLTKRPRYYYNRQAAKEANASPQQLAHNLKYAKDYSADAQRVAHGVPGSINSAGRHLRPGGVGRNFRSVWTINATPYKEAHFATFPEALVEPCITAGTSTKGCCPQCGTPWRQPKHQDRWEAGCRCGRRRAPVPCTVLDPFTGSGTTGAVALRLQRRFVGIELKPDYVQLATRRLRRVLRSAATLPKLFE